MIRRLLRLASALAPLLLLGSCAVDPFCLTCTEKDSGLRDGGATGGTGAADGGMNWVEGGVDGQAGSHGGTGGGGVAGSDAGGTAQCRTELCNGKDDDCDGEMDEDFDVTADPANCGVCGRECTPKHAFGACVDGTCAIDSCDLGAYDVNDDPSDGCEYRCTPVDTKDTICDLRDDDCDKKVDEDVAIETDEQNCGACNTVCALNNATAVCAAGVCSFAGCKPGFANADGNDQNGCELLCTPRVPAIELCNLRDDDCDGTADEGNPGGGAACGEHAGVGECKAGTTACEDGILVCNGAIEPTTELCNGKDDDCDSETDENNPDGGRLCGPSGGTCSQGRETCENGVLVCNGAVEPTAELCDGLDNNCDGTIDDGNPESGGNCGSDEGECGYGKENCVAGVIKCEGGQGPVAELCDGLDNDCDGDVDNNNPEGGRLCGSGEGQCVKGREACVGGTLVCQNAIGPQDELCDGLDNNCDGQIDEGNPGGGAACGTDVGECDFGSEVCVGGIYVCQGGKTAIDEKCNGKDDNCDGATDDGNPEAGRLCGSGTGQCVKGTEVCKDGALACEDGQGPVAELCNGLDDDCDDVIDNGNPGGGTACGTDEGECDFGSEVCQGGIYVCQGGITPADELCDGLDNNCDGATDEDNPEGGKICGSSVGTCSVGSQVCLAGQLVCQNAVGPQGEICDGLDNDCDSATDDGNPEGGTPCGSSVGQCKPGAEVCQGGTLVCQGGVTPVAELCDGLDNNCDGATDEGNPGAGNLCGSDVGRCSPGVEQCSGGGLVCTGATGPSDEACNGLDDDCDGAVDNGNPGGGADCGSDTGDCTFGSLSCQGGTLACLGGTGPTLDVCDTRDNDCDGQADEDFDTDTDINHCGNCATVCDPADATPECVSGACEIRACDQGHVDLDLDPDTGCEYACDSAGTEICNGLDDDCDGVADEDLLVPPNFCNPNGVCATTVATCGGASGWQCVYPPATHQQDELRCDLLDNDCDGEVDEGYPLLGMLCSNGTGACQRNGIYVCNAVHDDVQCNAPAAGTPADEQCDNLDNDCDGQVDERVADDLGTAWRDGVDVTAIDRVMVLRADGGFMEMMAYEASRPDATFSAAGAAGGYACSHPSVTPWTNVTWTEANAACCGLNAGGACPQPTDTGMWRLCDAPDWERACEGPSGSCDHSYATGCTSSQPLTCNGDEYDCDPSKPFDQDCLASTGDSQFPMCGTDWGSAGTVYDLSGNAKEWTATAKGSSIYEIRGGSYTNIEAGRSCDFDFVVAAQGFAHENTGFRCCYY